MEQLGGGHDRFHQPARGVRLRREQIVAQLVRQRPAHRPRQQHLALRDRHLVDRADDAARLGHHGLALASATVDLLLRHRRIVEHNPAERQPSVTRRCPVASPMSGAACSARTVRSSTGTRVIAAPRATPARRMTPAGTPDRVGFGKQRRDNSCGEMSAATRDADDHRWNRGRGCRWRGGERAGDEQRNRCGGGDQHHACNRRMQSAKV